MGEPESLAGRVLGGRYRLEYQLGEGGFGTIWRAEQLVLGASVAVKLIDMEIAHQPGALDRFLREAQAAATLRSPHVVQVLDYGVEGDQPFIAMELLEGETLAERLHRLGRLAPSEALRIVTHVARAISRAHECNIVHRDLKPDNVFLVHNEDEEVAKVLDFGVAKIKAPDWLDESTQTRTGSLIGTPHYMSPEQVQGNKSVDYRSDLWSLGIIAFEMFTGRRPFVGNALGDLVLQICVRDLPVPSRWAPVPTGFDDWFRKAAERDASERFQSARDLAQALREVVGGGERDVELVVADEMEVLLDAPATATAVSQAADKLVNSARSQLENAATLRGVPLTTAALNEPHGGSLATGAARRDSRRITVRKLWWVIGILSLVLVALALFASSRLFRNARNVAASRTSFMPLTNNNAPLPAVESSLLPPGTAIAPEHSVIRTESVRTHRATTKLPLTAATSAGPSDGSLRVPGRSQPRPTTSARVRQPTPPTETHTIVNVPASPSGTVLVNTPSVEPTAVIPKRTHDSEPAASATVAPPGHE